MSVSQGREEEDGEGLNVLVWGQQTPFEWKCSNLESSGCVIRACERVTMLFGLKEVLGSLCFVNRFLS